LSGLESLTSGTMVALLLCVAGILAPSAHAATVEARDGVPQYDRWGERYVLRTVVVIAAPGEANRLELRLLERNGVRAHDPAGLTPVAPCSAEGPETVVCPGTGDLNFDVALGDGDDTFSTAIDLPVQSESESESERDPSASYRICLGAAAVDGGPSESSRCCVSRTAAVAWRVFGGRVVACDAAR
jgi:hypothetical protein